jgi:Putative zinc-finger
MRHDPERTAAAYLAGELAPRQRDRFEAHMLGCDDCWREVTAGRAGRALAESLREVAPQQLRERVRATIAAAPAGRRRRIRLGTRMPALIGVVAALVAVGVAGGLLVVREHASAQPAPITAAVASYRAGVAAWTPTVEPAPASQLGGLTWQGASRGELAGLPVVAHTYQDVAGHRLVLLVADQPFPQAVGARHASSGATWTAQVDGAVLYCADHPAPSLLLGADRAEVVAAAQRLGLR